jgi:hypothetical protein
MVVYPEDIRLSSVEALVEGLPRVYTEHVYSELVESVEVWTKFELVL